MASVGMRPERVRWGLTRRQCLAGSSASSSLQDGEVKKQPVFDDQKAGIWGARASKNFGVHAKSVPAKYKMRRIGAGRGRIRARKLRVAARGGSGALAGSARWLRASRGRVRRVAGRSATHLARNAGRPGPGGPAAVKIRKSENSILLGHYRPPPPPPEVIGGFIPSQDIIKLM